MFSKFINRNKKEDIILDGSDELVNTYKELKSNSDNVVQEEEEWVWVDGYKGTMSDMTCRDFKFELNKQYDVDGETEECKNGFHLCLELSDVFNYYPLEPNIRFFKVRALVKRRDKLQYGRYTTHIGLGSIRCVNKIVAKSIVFQSELLYEDLKNHIKNKYPLVNSKEDYFIINTVKYDDFVRNKIISEIIKLGYSEAMSAVFYQHLKSKSDHFKLDFLKKVNAFKEEGLSKDMCVYLLLDSIESNK